jgi:hypothetical protein
MKLEDRRFEEPDDDILTIVTCLTYFMLLDPNMLVWKLIDSIPTSRGRVKDVIRSVVEYCFAFRKPALTQEDIEWNLNRYRLLHPNNFHTLVCISLVCFLIVLTFVTEP